MSRVRRWGLVVCIMLLAISIVGCGMVKVDPEKDRNRVVAKVDDTEILKGEFLDIYNQSKAMYGITDEAEKDPELRDTIKQLKEAVLGQLITEKVIYNKAVEAGFGVNDEIIEETKKELLAELEETLREDGKTTAEEAKELVREQLDEYIEITGMTEEQFWEIVAEQEQMEKFIEEQLVDIEVTEEEIQEFYNEQLEGQKADPKAAENAQVMLHIPEGFRRIKHILIGISDEDIKEYSNLLADDKKDEAEKFLEKKLEKLKPEAKKVLEKAQDGQDFEKLIEEYSTDFGMDIEEGYTLSMETNFVESFKEAAFDLEKEGDISGLVPSDYGYHIIKLYDLPGKDYALEEKKDAIEMVVESEKKNEKWAYMLQEWEEEAEIKKYEKRL